MNETGDSYYRMRWPARDLSFQAPDWRVINLDSLAKERFVWGEHADLLVLYQSNDLDLVPLIEKRRRMGLKTLVEYNDNFYEAPSWSPVADVWSSPLLWQRYELLMRISDGIIVTGDNLREILSSHVHQRFHVIENHMPAKLEPFPSLRNRKTPYTSIGWGGSLGHIADLLSIVPVLRQVLKEFPDVKLHIMGNESIPSLIELAPDRLVFSKWGPMEEYYRFWEDIHIGIAPLLDTGYNKGRSDIKAVEMSSRGVLPLLPNAPAYKHFLEATDVPPFESHQDLLELLREYIKDTASSDQLAARCHAYVCTNRIGAERTERLALYEQMSDSVPPSAFQWPMLAGYYETQGAAQDKTAQQIAFDRINELHRKGSVNESLAAASAFCAEQPLNAEAWLVKLRCLASARKPEFQQQAQEASFKFPDDVRFAMLSIEQDSGDTTEKWRAFLKRLITLPDNYRHTFEPDILGLYTRQLRRLPVILELAPTLLNMYPSSAYLRYELAELLRRLGRDREAEEHFSWLCKAKRMYTENRGFLENIEINYLEAWRSALEARSKGH